MQTTPVRSDRDDLGKLVLRVVLAVLLLFHGLSKIGGGVGFIEGMLQRIGLPAVFAYGVFIGEVLAPLLILAGLFTRAAALVVAINMVVALLLVHTGEFFAFSDTGGWALELQGLFLGTAIALVFLGAGRHSVGGAGGRWN